MRRASITFLALLMMTFVGCENSTPPTAVDSDLMKSSVKSSSKSKKLKGKFKSFEVNWVVSHFSEQICTGGASLVAGADISSSGKLSMLSKTEANVSAAWDWAQSAAGEFAATGPATGTSATVLASSPYNFNVDPFATLDPFSPTCGPAVSATGRMVLVSKKGDEVHGIVTGGEVYELAFNQPGDGQEIFLMVDIRGGTGRFFGAAGSFVIHSLFDLAAGDVVSSEIMKGGSIELRKSKKLKGKIKEITGDWFVSHFSEQICSGNVNQVAGASIHSRGNLSHLGKTEVSLSTAWDWQLPAAGEYLPSGPRSTDASATILSTYPYTFAVDPFATSDPFAPVCGDAVSASGDVILHAKHEEIHATVTGGEVYELTYSLPGDGQEVFMEVTIDGGTGRFADAMGFFVIHAIFDLAGGEILESEILRGGVIAF